MYPGLSTFRAPGNRISGHVLAIVSRGHAFLGSQGILPALRFRVRMEGSSPWEIDGLGGTRFAQPDALVGDGYQGVTQILVTELFERRKKMGTNKVRTLIAKAETDDATMA